MWGACPEVIGRQSQLAAMAAALGRAVAADPSLLLVTGEAGIGKSRVAGELQRNGAAAGFRVLRGECADTAGGELPYAPLALALRDVALEVLLDALGALAPAARQDVAAMLPWLATDGEPRDARSTVEPDAARQSRLFGGLAALLRVLADSAPLMLVLEDLHWADRSTLDFLGYLTRGLRDERLLIVATVRAEVLEPQLQPRDGASPGLALRRAVNELTRLARVQRVELEPLSPEEVDAMVACILGEGAPVAVARRIIRRSSGNPYHVEELAAAAGDTAQLVPRDVRESMLVRVEGLSAAGRQVLRAAAGVARAVDQRLLGEVAGLDDARLALGLREALDASLLQRESDDAFGYRHALAREAVYGELLPGERRGLHAATAAALSGGGAATSSAELAHHWHAAGEHDRALRTSFDAAAQAEAVFASAEALAHYSRVLELWDRAPGVAADLPLDRIGVIARTADAAFLAAEHDRCAALWRDAVERVDATLHPERASWLYHRLGRAQPWNVQESLDCYTRALGLLGDEPSPQRASLLADIGRGLTFQERWEEARAHAERALAVASAAGVDEASARSTLGVSLAFLGDCDAGERELRVALGLVRELGVARDHVRVLLDLAEILRLMGRFAEALEVVREGEQVTADTGMEESLGAFMTANGAEDELRLGRWDAAAASLSELAGRDLGPPAMLTRESVAGRLCTARGDFAAATAHFARAVEVSEEVQAVEFAPAIRAGLAELALWQGRPGDALNEVTAGLQTVGEALDPLHAPVLLSIGVRAHADAAQRERKPATRGPRTSADEAVGSLLEGLDSIIELHRDVGGAPEALAHRALAAAELARMHGESGIPLWEQAAALWDGLDAPYPATYARWRAAEALVALPGGRGAALVALQAARDAAASLGARPLLDAIEELAKRARLKLTVGSVAVPEAPPVEADDLGLTAREFDVLHLLALGLTDKQIGERLFISSRTAQVHVSRIRMKLGARTRTAAAGVAQRMGLIRR